MFFYWLKIESKEKKNLFTWDVDSNYDPSSILDFEFEYLKQDPDWPYKKNKRLIAHPNPEKHC